MSDKHILLADPDAKTAEELREALGAGWVVNSVDTGTAALRELKIQTYDGLVASLHLADMQPKQLLNRVRTKFPKTVRFIVANEQDRDRVVKEVLGAHQFLIRPFTSEGLQKTFQAAFASESWVASEALRKLVARMRTLPTIPALYLDIVEALRSPNTTTEDVGALIGQDMAITTKLLQVINSAYFGLPRTVTSPAEAVALLGFETSKCMVTAVKLLNQYDRIKIGEFSIDGLWRHSIAVAQNSRKLVMLQDGNGAEAETAFAAGLLHDVGKAVLAGNFGEQYAGAESLARKNKLALWAVEKEIFGASHGEVGAYLLSLWGLPAEVLDAAALHHEPGRSKNEGFSVLTAVHVANTLQYVVNSDSQAPIGPELDLAYLEQIGVIDSLPRWCEELLGEEEAARYLAPATDKSKSGVPQQELAFSPPPASLLAGVHPELAATPGDNLPRVPEPHAEATPEEVDTQVAAIAPEETAETLESSGASVSAEREVIENPFEPALSSEFSTEKPADDPPRLEPNRGRRNRWITAAAVPTLLLVIACFVIGRMVRPAGSTEDVRARTRDPKPEALSTPQVSATHTKAVELPQPDVTNSVANVTTNGTSALSDVKSETEQAAAAQQLTPAKRPSFPELKLQGILFSPQHPSAIINGVLLHPNEMLAGARIIQIRPTTVTIEFHNERRILALE